MFDWYYYESTASIITVGENTNQLKVPVVQKFWLISKLKLRRFPTLLFLFGTVALLCWHWQLLLATLAGVSLMQAIYLSSGWNWQNWLQNWEKLTTHSNRRFGLAVGGGGLTAIIVYLFSSIFAHTQNRWLAFGLILQTLLSLVTVVLLVWQLLSRKNHRQDLTWQRWLMDLTDLDPLKRLIAVRQLLSLAKDQQLNTTQLEQLREYLQLMLSVETEPLIRQAILTNFQTFLNSPVNIPLQMPLNFKANSFDHHQR